MILTRFNRPEIKNRMYSANQINQYFDKLHMSCSNLHMFQQTHMYTVHS